MFHVTPNGTIVTARQNKQFQRTATALNLLLSETCLPPEYLL